MLALAVSVAVFASLLFTGAAVYVSVVEHPARMACRTEIAATVWRPSYRRAAALQSALVIVSVIASIAAWALGGSALWLAAAALMASMVPITFGLIWPTNRKLLEPARDLSSAETGSLLVRWGRLHSVRTVVSLLAAELVIFLATRR